MRRPDAQELSLSLLKLDWNSEGYLIGVKRYSKIWKFLSSPAKDVYRPMMRIFDGLPTLGLEDGQKRSLGQKLKPALETANKENLERFDLKTFFEVECEIAGILVPFGIAIDAVCILTITNAEFLSLVGQASRYANARTSTGLIIDPKNEVVKVPSTMGIIQEFPMDLCKLYPQPVPQDYPQEEIMLPLHIVVLAALKACLRSALLQGSWPAEPLVRWIAQYTNLDSPHKAYFL